jgi:hypothetical protein
MLLVVCVFEKLLNVGRMCRLKSSLANTASVRPCHPLLASDVPVELFLGRHRKERGGVSTLVHERAFQRPSSRLWSTRHHRLVMAGGARKFLNVNLSNDAHPLKHRTCLIAPVQATEMPASNPRHLFAYSSSTLVSVVCQLMLSVSNYFFVFRDCPHDMHRVGGQENVRCRRSLVQGRPRHCDISKPASTQGRKKAAVRDSIPKTQAMP